MRKIKNKLTLPVEKFFTEHPQAVKPMASLMIATMSITQTVLADFDPSNATNVLFNYATAIVSGVGIVYAVIAIFNWVSAMKQEDAERQSKALVNIFIAGILIAIGVVTRVIISALGGSVPGGNDNGLNSN